jgi:hypothetical protein
VARRHDHELTGRQLVFIFLQRLIQVFDLRLQLGARKPEQQDAGVGKTLVEHRLSEIAVLQEPKAPLGSALRVILIYARIAM